MKRIRLTHSLLVGLPFIKPMLQYVVGQPKSEEILETQVLAKEKRVVPLQWNKRTCNYRLYSFYLFQ